MIACFPLRHGPLPPGPGVLFGWRITSTFGGRINPVTGRPGNHGGMDLAFIGCTGEPIMAPCGGLVAQGWDPSGGGNWTGIVGDDGCYWGLGHALRFAPGVAGRRVLAGTVVAYVGTTGGSTGPHLHIAYRAPGAGRYCDPWDLLHAAEVRGAMPAGRLISIPAALTKDWLDMATEDDVRRIVREELRTAGEYILVVDGRAAARGTGALQAWVINGFKKRWMPTNDYTEWVKALGRDGVAVRDVGLRGDGDPYIALLDLCELAGTEHP